MQHGDVATPADLQRLAETAVRQAGRGSLPFVLAAHASADRLPELDAFIDVVLNQPVSNRASRAQGRAFLGSARQIFGGAPVQSVADRVARWLPEMRGRLTDGTGDAGFAPAKSTG